MDYISSENYQSLSKLEVAEYEECEFNSCDFSNKDLSGSKFINCQFSDCNLSNSNMNGVALQEVEFRNCKLLGVDFSICNSFGFEVSFSACQLNHSSFFKLKLNRGQFRSCQMHGVDLVEVDLTGGVLYDCDLLDAQFEATRLEKADLRDSKNYSIDPELNFIRGARFSLPDVVGLLDKYGLEIKD